MCSTKKYYFNIEYDSQLANERAMMELLQLEHKRVSSELDFAQKRGSPRPDLKNQLAVLSERMEQQTTLIDDLEYQYQEDKANYEEEKEKCLTKLRIHNGLNSVTDNPVDVTNSSIKRTLQPQLLKSGSKPVNIFSPAYINGYHVHTRFTESSAEIADDDLATQLQPTANDIAKKSYSGSNDVQFNARVSEAIASQIYSKSGIDMSGRIDVFRHLSSSTEPPIRRTVPPSNSSLSNYWQPLMESHNSALTPVSACHRDKISIPVYNEDKQSPDSHSVSSTQQMLYHRSDVGASSSGSSLAPTTTNQVNNSKGLAYSPSLLPTTSFIDDFVDTGSVCGVTLQNCQIFSAVPPLPSSGRLSNEISHFNSNDTINQRDIPTSRRSQSTSGRQAWHDIKARPLTRYLPVPDDVSFDLRNHLENVCGHLLSSPVLYSQVTVEPTKCSGFLYKLDSSLSHCPVSPEFDAISSPRIHRRKNNASSGLHAVPASSGMVGSALNFFRRRQKRRRWFVLDRRRRFLAYYSNHPSKPSLASLKPKDVISFTDIIDVYPDHQSRGQNDSHANGSANFCLLLLATPSFEGSAWDERGGDPPSIRTRHLYLAAPSPEVMRVWVGALFTCAGAYLCLSSSGGGNCRNTSKSATMQG